MSVLGIRDERRSYPDPYLSLEEDVAAAQALAGRFAELDFPGLLRESWRWSGKPRELVEQFVARELAAGRKSPDVLDAVEGELGRPLRPGERLLEVGCGTAALAAEAARRAAAVTASDVSLRRLVLAKKRLAAAGAAAVELVCCAGEDTPFPDESFDVVLGCDVIEHVRDPAAFVAGCRRVLRPGGRLFLATPNRYSLGLEPHVRLPFVGWLPRRLAKRYVETVRRLPYDHVHLLSARDLGALLRAHGFRVKIVPPEIPAATVALYRGPERRLVQAYNLLRRAPAARTLLLAVGPFFHVFATRR